MLNHWVMQIIREGQWVGQILSQNTDILESFKDSKGINWKSIFYALFGEKVIKKNIMEAYISPVINKKS